LATKVIILACSKNIPGTQEERLTVA